MRLVNETAVGAWQVGRLEIFFEGSWSQVCGSGFDVADADVVCNQLGYGAGTIHVNAELSGFDQSESLFDATGVYPRVALTSPGCTGSEARLLECPVDVEKISSPGPNNIRGIGCFGPGRIGNRRESGLVIACVREPESGAYACRNATYGDGFMFQICVPDCIIQCKVFSSPLLISVHDLAIVEYGSTSTRCFADYGHQAGR